VSYVHFTNKDYEYYLLDKSSKAPDGNFSPFSELVVFKDKEILYRSICENDDSGINQDAYDKMPREPYAFATLEPLQLSNASPR
jgi:hypothetical protein